MRGTGELGNWRTGESHAEQHSQAGGMEEQEHQYGHDCFGASDFSSPIHIVVMRSEE